MLDESTRESDDSTGTTPQTPQESGGGLRITGAALAAVFSGLLVTMLLASLDQLIFATTLPTVVGELNGVEHQLWMTTAYLLTSTVMMPVYGKLGDLIGRKGLLVGAIAVFLVGSVIGGSATSMGALVTARAVQGIGGGGLIILAQSIIADVVPARRRGMFMGAMGAVYGLSSVIGPLLGGWFTEHTGWRWAFWFNIPLGLLAIAMVLVFLRLPRPQRTVFLDWGGIASVAVATSAITLVSAWGGNTYAWGSRQIISLGVLALVASGVVVLVERRAVEAVVPLHLFTARNFNLATLAGLILAIGMFGVVSYLPTYFQMVHGYSATGAGLLLIPLVVGMAAAALTTGGLASRTNRYRWMPIASSLVLAGGLYLLSTVETSTSVFVVCCFLGIIGIGIGLGQQILVLIVQNTFPDREVGVATAINNFFRQIGATLGSAVVGSVFTSRLVSELTTRMAAAGAGGPEQQTGVSGLTPAIVAHMPEPLRLIVADSYSAALIPVFGFLVPLILVNVVVGLFIKEVPLRTTIDT